MKRADLEARCRGLSEDLGKRIADSPISAALLFLALGFLVGVFRGLFVPVLLIAAAVYGVIWWMDGRSITACFSSAGCNPMDKFAAEEEKKEETPSVH